MKQTIHTVTSYGFVSLETMLTLKFTLLNRTNYAHYFHCWSPALSQTNNVSKKARKQHMLSHSDMHVPNANSHTHEIFYLTYICDEIFKPPLKIFHHPESQSLFIRRMELQQCVWLRVEWRGRQLISTPILFGNLI